MLHLAYDPRLLQALPDAAALLPVARFDASRRALVVDAAVGDAIRLSPDGDAPLAVVPFQWHLVREPAARERARAYVAEQWASGRRTLVFNISDAPLATLGPGSIVYEPSSRASRMDPRRTAPMPVFLGRGRFSGVPVHPPAAWSPRPAVGFCGFCGVTARDRLKLALLRLRGAVTRDAARYRSLRMAMFGKSVRDDVLRALRRCPDVDAHFIERSAFWGGAWAVPAAEAAASKARVRDDFVANLLQCPYNVCARGAGNFSYRFYETLASGRIPVFCDTDCALPLDVDWREHCVWIPHDDLARAGERLLAFHRARGEDGLRALQQRNADLWRSRLSAVGFFRELEDDLRRRAFVS